MTKPDFIIVGAMKCGTSTLQTQLAAQPGIFMTTPKEPNFFSDDDVYAHGVEWYASLYADAGESDLKGEASTHYTKLPTYPRTMERLQAYCDAPKIIYLIRDPVTRAVSHYIHEWSMGVMGADIVSAFAEHREIVDYGRYAYQIAPFIEAFGQDAVHLLSLEAMKSNPQAELEKIWSHLDMPGSAKWDDTQEAQNVSAERIRKFPLHGLLIDNPLAATLRRTLVPKGLRDRIRKSRTIGDRPSLTDELRAELQKVYLEDREELAKLFPNHPALTEAYPFATT